MARPEFWTSKKKNDAIELILIRIREGESGRKILDNADRNKLPSFVTFCNWLREDEQLSKQYAQACYDRADSIFDEILDIADDSSHDEIVTDKGIVFNSEYAARSKIRIDARKWVLSKMMPKKYGDRIQHANDPDNPMDFTLNINSPTSE